MPGFPTTEPTESEQLLVFLAQQRRVLSHAAYGLSDEQARLTPSVSVLSVGGIVKHVSHVEKFWTDVVLGRQAPFGTDGDYQEGFRLGPTKPWLAPSSATPPSAGKPNGSSVRYPSTTLSRYLAMSPGSRPTPSPGRFAGSAAPDRRNSAPRRSRRHRARIDRRGYLVRSHGGRRELATLALGQALATSRLGGPYASLAV